MPPINQPSKINADFLIKWVSSWEISSEEKKPSDNPFAISKNDQISQAQEMRFLSVRYKVYSVIVIAIIVIGHSRWMSAISTTWAKRNSLDQIDSEINNTITKQETYKKEKELFTIININQPTLIDCINKQSNCDKLPEIISKNINTIKAYIQLWDLKKTKMKVDERKILKIINEFMTQKNILSEERSYNSSVTSINIGDPTSLENNIIKVPLDLMLTFNNKQDLLNFLSNIESYVFSSPEDGLKSSVLLRIESLNYDIINNKESQDVEISLSAYAYNG